MEGGGQHPFADANVTALGRTVGTQSLGLQAAQRALNPDLELPRWDACVFLTEGFWAGAVAGGCLGGVS